MLFTSRMQCIVGQASIDSVVRCQSMTPPQPVLYYIVALSDTGQPLKSEDSTLASPWLAGSLQAPCTPSGAVVSFSLLSCHTLTVLAANPCTLDLTLDIQSLKCEILLCFIMACRLVGPACTPFAGQVGCSICHTMTLQYPLPSLCKSTRICSRTHDAKNKIHIL